MRTDNKTMIEVLQKVISNIEHGIKPTNGIQVHINEWEDKDYIDFQPNEFLYRIKPETITLKNGVTIPKPLRDSEILEDVAYYHVDNSKLLYNVRDGKFIADHGIRFVYETKQEAIEASKALFGIED